MKMINERKRLISKRRPKTSSFQRTQIDNIYGLSHEREYSISNLMVITICFFYAGYYVATSMNTFLYKTHSDIM